MLHIVRNILLLAFLAIWASCSNIKMLTQEEIYSAKFLKKIEGIQLIYRDGDKNGALRKLGELNDVNLSTVEKAKKYNFIGVIHFSNENYNAAIENFLIAKENIGVDKNLNRRDYWNTYFEKAQESIDHTKDEVDGFMPFINEAFETLKSTNAKQISYSISFI